MDLPLPALGGQWRGRRAARLRPLAPAGAHASPRSRLSASGASAPSRTSLGQPRSLPSPWHRLAVTSRSFFARRAGCWEVQRAVAAPAAQLGEERGLGRAREAARGSRFCEFCRWGAKEGCRLGGGGRGGVMLVLNVAAQLPGELPERRARSPADSACSAPDAAHRGQEPLPAPLLSAGL